ncbi:MAG: hypothetical protein L6R00_19485 [Phycisphaerae bacterium]|nr:hypothetical protein [Phycisphaerae bacterium]
MESAATDRRPAQRAAALRDAAAAAAPAKSAAPARLLAVAAVAAQLLALIYIYARLELGGRAFLMLMACCVAGFVVHALLPAAARKAAFVLISLAGGVLILPHVDPWAYEGLNSYVSSFIFVAILLALGLVFYGCLRLPAPFALRIGMVLALAAWLAYQRSQNALLSDVYWRIIGAIFMFRLIVYAYEVRFARKPESLGDFLCYFYLLPNFYFTLFPVVDYATFKKCRAADDLLPTAQRGVAWIVRGTIQLCIHQILYHEIVIGADDVRSFGSLCRFIFPTYLLYVKISGQFHIIAGMLHLFGYRLPETNRRYLLAESFTDFWRRINIYWKDFMVKCFYYPAYFRLRKRNEMLALCVATIWVFLATTLLHGYQTFWLQGRFLITSGDLIFWPILGVLVMITVVRQARRGRPKPRPPAVTWTIRVASIVAVYVTISVLWSLWSAESPRTWFETVTYWRN